MIEKVFSKKQPETLLHIINKLENIQNRLNISPDEQFLQLALLKMDKGKTFLPHKHIWKSCEDKTIAQESWVVIKGKVKVFLYDIDDKIIYTTILNPGDCSVTFFGGHNYEILEDDTIVYEYKTGPYKGQEKDKEFVI